MKLNKKVEMHHGAKASDGSPLTAMFLAVEWRAASICLCTHSHVVPGGDE